MIYLINYKSYTTRKTATDTPIVKMIREYNIIYINFKDINDQCQVDIT